MTTEEHIVIQPQPTKWLVTALASLGVVLSGALLISIASNQKEMSTTMAVMQSEFAAQSRAFNEYNAVNRRDSQEVRDWLAQIWPRLRVHGENAEILKRHLESLCKCKIELNDPERF